MGKDWQTSLEALHELGITDVEYKETLTSSVTTSWGVEWDEQYIARDILQNFFDANRSNVHNIDIKTNGSVIEICAPAAFNLKELFYLGSKKGDDDVGQYGEGFKAAAMCLLRDHRVVPLMICENSVVCMRVAHMPVENTDLYPIIYDFFAKSDPIPGSMLILKGCSKSISKAMDNGLDNFLYEENRLLGESLWRSWDNSFQIFSSRSGEGYIFYKKLRRGVIHGIPLVIIIDKEYKTIETIIAQDRDRKAFGDKLLDKFFKTFAQGAARENLMVQKIILEASREIWAKGHSLLAAMADKTWRSLWTREDSAAVFGEHYFARTDTRRIGELYKYAEIKNKENEWEKEGRIALPGYFSDFGVVNYHFFIQDLKDRALRESETRFKRKPTSTEYKAIELFSNAFRSLSQHFYTLLSSKNAIYFITEDEVLLGELKNARGYKSHEVYLAEHIFLSDFAAALSTFLHEHTHMFGYDGSRTFSDALTELLEAIIRERVALEKFEGQWKEIGQVIMTERKHKGSSSKDIYDFFTTLSPADLREALRMIPFDVLTNIHASLRTRELRNKSSIS